MTAHNQSRRNVSYEDEPAVNMTKVCNICGDSGHKGSLAVCSKCEDGAEHIYCMRVSMDQLPDSSWMCEECVLEEKVKLKNARSGISVFSKRRHTLMRKKSERETKIGLSLITRDHGPSYLTTKSNHALSSRSRSIQAQDNEAVPLLSGNFTKSNSSKGLDKIPTVSPLDEVPLNQFSNETHSRKINSTQRSLSRTVSFSDARSGIQEGCEAVSSLSGNFTKSNSSKGLDKIRTVSPLDEVPLNQFSNETHSRKINSTQRSLSRTVSFSDARSGIQEGCEAVSSLSGNFMKSSSFEGLDKRSKLSPLEEIPQNQFSNETHSRKKFSTLSALSRTVSLNGVSSGRSTASIPKFQSTSSKPFGVSDWIINTNETSSKSSDNMQGGGNAYIGRIEETHPEVGCSGHSLEFMSQMDTSYKEIPTFAFPDFDYIWRGEFEIQQSERLPNVLYRIQAHLSSLASPMIPDVVKDFPSEISLEEVSRMDAWPYQFQERDPQDNNIALYFFAQDNVSYENYRSLLHLMTLHDLALRGNVSGIEVLIYSSSMLQKGSRYWNGLLFLWGVFRCRKVVESQIAV